MGSNPTLRQAGCFVSEMKLENWRFFPERLDRTVIISDGLLLTHDEIWISDRAADCRRGDRDVEGVARQHRHLVTPAKAGVQDGCHVAFVPCRTRRLSTPRAWIPAFAGMTED